MLGADADTKRLDGSMNKLGQTVTRIGTTIAGVFAIDRLASFAKQIVLITAATASFNNAILASSRSEGEGRANLYFLNQQVDRLGLNLQAAQNGYKTFSGAVMGSNIQGAKSNKIFRQVSEASTVLGLSAEQTEGSFLALGQMISKGTVQAEELRGQLAERIPGAFQIGARAMGMTSKQLGEAMKNGLINSEEFLIKFGDELERTFGGKLGKAVDSVQSNLNRMETAWTRLQSNIGESNTGIINGFTKLTTSLINQMNQIVSTTNKMSAAFNQFGAKDFTFFQQKGSMLAGFAPFLTSKVREAEKSFEHREKLIGQAGTDRTKLLGLKEGLFLERETLSRNFANKKLNKEDYQREYALISAALESVSGNLTLGENAGNKLGAPGSDTKKPTDIGSPIDVSGARAQNITINVDKLVETLNIHSETMEGGTKEAAYLTKKAFLELLNDANTIANG